MNCWRTLFSPKSRLSKGVCVAEESRQDFISVQNCLEAICRQQRFSLISLAAQAQHTALSACFELLLEVRANSWAALQSVVFFSSFFLLETRKAYCTMDQVRENCANQSNPYQMQLRNLNISLSPSHVFRSHFLLLWLEGTHFAKKKTQHPHPTNLWA